MANIVSIENYGGNSSSTLEQNFQALQSAIKDINLKGGGIIFIPPKIEYGYIFNEPAHQPNLTETSTDILIIDCSRGNSYSHPERDGEQVRLFLHTEGNQLDAGHNGNGFIIRGHWHPYIMVSNDGEDINNKRASLWFADKGNIIWGIGQSTAASTLSESFGIVGYDSNILTIRRVEEKFHIGWNTQTPEHEFHFCTRNEGRGVFLFHSKANTEISLRAGEKTRSLELRSDNGSVGITDLHAKSHVFVVDASGNGFFKHGVTGNAFASISRPDDVAIGTMIFDTTLKKPIWWSGSERGWVDAMGQAV